MRFTLLPLCSSTCPDGAAKYAAAFPNAAAGMGCPATGCIGYELAADLDFDTNGNGSADSGDDYWNDGKGWIPLIGGERIDDALKAPSPGPTSPKPHEQLGISPEFIVESMECGASK